MKQVYKNVLADIITTCLNNGIKFNLSPTKKVFLDEKDLGCSGFFDSNLKILSVATGHPIKFWFSTLLHEYNHLLQYIENPKKFDGGGIDLWKWISGDIKATKKEARLAINYSRDMELDCEKRTVKLIKSLPELDMDIDEYIMSGNAYLYFYSIVYKYRKWSIKPPYKIKEIVELMPNKFLKSYWKMPKGYEELVIKYCLKKEKK